MDRYTAQVLVGECELCNGGIIPEYQIFLSEDDRPVLIMREVNRESEWLWFPGKESLLDDIFLMISSVIFQEIEVRDLERLSLLDIYTEKERDDYYRMVQKQSKNWNKKIIVNLFHNSLLENHIDHLKDYGCNMEVTRSYFLQEQDQNGNNKTKGHL
jgi:biotin operon repressor